MATKKDTKSPAAAATEADTAKSAATRQDAEDGAKAAEKTAAPEAGGAKTSPAPDPAAAAVADPAAGPATATDVTSGAGPTVPDAGPVSGSDPGAGAAFGLRAEGAPATRGPDFDGSAGAGLSEGELGARFVVRGPKRGRWRAGRFFGPEPVTLRLADLTEAEREALTSDPVLSIGLSPAP
ncbi:hypothetical protein T8T21_00715 [Limimaricola variabilis]|uniref:hypothetical protein n=1 Tax=Limimaricola variabilis TaxID=1492771 RepID=UPI002AC9D60B|nr:hypothetical protein [Limimaricola variabilis]WPY94680.1 hypothetical protein T8T21_00715 [Limimaricola variabilis]